jgi:ubiquinone/menaquinone biosynthesis C-methylase UbiE
MNFNWTSHIKTLGDFPEIKMLGEKQLVSAIKNAVPKGNIKKVLEVGCSNGRWLRWFKKEYNCEVFGLDNNSEGFVNNQDIDFTVGDARKMPFKDNSFDLVFSLGLVEHFNKKERELLLKEQTRVLKDNGYLICLVPLMSPSLNFLYVKLNYDLRKGFKHFLTTKRGMEKHFKDGGVKIIYSEIIGNIFESLIGIGAMEVLLKNKLFAKILATEILIIGEKK